MAGRYQATYDDLVVAAEEAELDGWGGTWQRRWARVWLWVGRIVLVGSIVAFAVVLATRSVWLAEGVDADGLPLSPVFAIAVVAGLLGGGSASLTLGPVGSAVLARRDGDDLTVETVLGRRRVAVPGARVVRLRLPGNGWGVSVMVVVDRRRRVIVLMASEFWSGPGVLERLLTPTALTTREAARAAGRSQDWPWARLSTHVLGWIALGGITAGALIGGAVVTFVLVGP